PLSSRLLHISLSPCFVLMLLPPPVPTLFPYTTLFRSLAGVRTSTVKHFTGLGSLPRFPAPLRSLGRSRDPMRFGTPWQPLPPAQDRKSTRLNSSHVKISYAVFCLKKKKQSQ